MRHAVKGRKLGRTTSHREALFRNQLQSLVEKEKIITTLPKAKELRPIAERVITRGKHGTVHDRRWVLRWVLKRDLVKKVFDDIAPRFHERPGGYLRIVKLGPRQGDGAEMAVLELVEREAAAAAAEPAAQKKPKKGVAKKARPKAEAKEPAAEEEQEKETKAKAKPKPKAAPSPKHETRKDTAPVGKVHTHKEGKAQTSPPKKIGS
jgi:large subunit ribosomal protein L17